MNAAERMLRGCQELLLISSICLNGPLTCIHEEVNISERALTVVMGSGELSARLRNDRNEAVHWRTLHRFRLAGRPPQRRPRAGLSVGRRGGVSPRHRPCGSTAVSLLDQSARGTTLQLAAMISDHSASSASHSVGGPVVRHRF